MFSVVETLRSGGSPGASGRLGVGITADLATRTQHLTLKRPSVHRTAHLSAGKQKAAPPAKRATGRAAYRNGANRRRAGFKIGGGAVEGRSAALSTETPPHRVSQTLVSGALARD